MDATQRRAMADEQRITNLRIALNDIIAIDHHWHGPVSRATEIARAALNRDDDTQIPAAPQAVPAEDIAGRECPIGIKPEAAQFCSAGTCVHCALHRSEAEATSLRKELEGAERDAQHWKDACFYEKQTVRNIVVAAGTRDDHHDIFDHLAEIRAKAARAEAAERKLEEAREALSWRTDMENAPKDGTVVNVVGRYPDATAGFPRYAAFLEEDGDWFELSRNNPERVVPWAWRPRDDWPQEPATRQALESDNG